MVRPAGLELANRNTEIKTELRFNDAVEDACLCSGVLCPLCFRGLFNSGTKDNPLRQT